MILSLAAAAEWNPENTQHHEEGRNESHDDISDVYVSESIIRLVEADVFVCGSNDYFDKLVYSPRIAANCRIDNAADVSTIVIEYFIGFAGVMLIQHISESSDGALEWSVPIRYVSNSCGVGVLDHHA
ncbi:hypothetical protein AYI69_g935 [Smittium culicis]|uniref:Uncharacterized protein n=1 Tax=Smittium culicis TaxID=133412 RepID=A0A1R1YRM6_9FUNG|nr:hypothetical protein AYI69_g935 [Smittium culicis]